MFGSTEMSQDAFFSVSEAKNSPVMSPLQLEVVCVRVCLHVLMLSLYSCLLVSVTVHPCLSLFKGIIHKSIPKLKITDTSTH